MSIMSEKIHRRRFLRGAFGGAAVALALPFLDIFLDDNGEALAATGEDLPVRFGTWFWGLGMDKKIFVPQKIGADYDLPEQLAPLKDVRQYVNVFSNYNVQRDGRSNLCHYTGWVGLRCGHAPSTRSDLPAPSLDVNISDAIGGGTRFRSLEMAATGNPRHSYSFRSADAINAPETTATDLYRKIFGPGFADPNSPNFTPDPATMVEKSVLSTVREDSASLKAMLGAADRAKLDRYFTSVREIEGRLALQLQKPPPAPLCRMPAAPKSEPPVGVEMQLVGERHALMTDLLVMALACNQTRVFNMVYSDSSSSVTRLGHPETHHIVTHEESVDDRLGYQPTNNIFLKEAMSNWAYFVSAMAKQPEGSGALLDRMVIFAHSDQNFAKAHTIEGIPMMTAGSAGGRLRTGLHIDGREAPGSQLGYTLQRVMGLQLNTWGGDSMATSTTISEIVV